MNKRTKVRVVCAAQNTSLREVARRADISLTQLLGVFAEERRASARLMDRLEKVLGRPALKFIQSDTTAVDLMSFK